MIGIHSWEAAPQREIALTERMEGTCRLPLRGEGQGSLCPGSLEGPGGREVRRCWLDSEYGSVDGAIDRPQWLLITMPILM